MIRRQFLQRLLWLLPVFAAPVAALQAKPKRKTASASPAPASGDKPGADNPVGKSGAATARLRLWRSGNLSDRGALKMRLLLDGKPDSAAIPLPFEGLDYLATAYASVPSGPAVIEVSAPDHPPLRLAVYLAGGSISTLLVRQQGSGLSADWMDDSLAGSAEAGSDLNIYNLLPASNDIQVGVGDLLTTRLGGSRGSVRLGGIKRALYTVTVNLLEPGGKGYRWSSEVDFRRYHKATVLVVQDSYGRLRPRLVIDNDALAPAESAGAAAH